MDITSRLVMMSNITDIRMTRMIRMTDIRRKITKITETMVIPWISRDQLILEMMITTTTTMMTIMMMMTTKIIVL